MNVCMYVCMYLGMHVFMYVGASAADIFLSRCLSPKVRLLLADGAKANSSPILCCKPGTVLQALLGCLIWSDELDKIKKRMIQQ